MPLAIRTRRAKGFCVLELTGELTLGPALRDVVDQACETLKQYAPPILLLNFSGVRRLDSAGLGELIRLYELASQNQCRIALLGPDRNVLQLLQVTRLDAFLPCFPGETAALAAMRG